MNNFDWIQDLAGTDTLKPLSEMEHEIMVYTITMKDFLIMPNLDYRELAKTDASLRSLLN